MRMLILLATTLLIVACVDTRSFDSMSVDERLRVGSAQLDRACMVNGDPHEPGWQGRREIARGREYLAYVSAHARDGELDRHISTQALEVCLQTEGWPRRDVRQLILSAGSDQHVEMIVQAAATPRFYCGTGMARRFGPHAAARLAAACDRLGLQESVP